MRYEEKTSATQAAERSDHPSAGDVETARLALKKYWEELAPYVDEARELSARVSDDPSLLRDQWVSAQTRWLSLFDPEIKAVQDVYNTTEIKARLPVDAIRTARDAAAELLRIVEKGRQITEAQNSATQNGTHDSV